MTVSLSRYFQKNGDIMVASNAGNGVVHDLTISPSGTLIRENVWGAGWFGGAGWRSWCWTSWGPV